MNEHPFSCQDCDEIPKERFRVYEPVDDWLIAYPDRKLIHIHFGKSTYDDKMNIAEAQFHWKWVQELVREHPTVRFFFVLDMLRKDNSEILARETRDLYRNIRTHPQIVGGVAYGLTWGMRMIMELLNAMGLGAHIPLVGTEAEARAVYEKWLADER